MYNQHKDSNCFIDKCLMALQIYKLNKSIISHFISIPQRKSKRIGHKVNIGTISKT